MIIDEDEELFHYGILRRSGRYPYGSGKSGAAPYPWSLSKSENVRNRTFLDTIKHLLGMGMSESEIAKGYGISTTELRTAKTRALAQQKMQEILTAEGLKAKGLSNKAIAEKMGVSGESYVRTLLAPGAKDKADKLTQTRDFLKHHVDEKQYVDVGKGTENYMNVSREMKNAAIAMLREEGYERHYLQIEQQGTGKFTSTIILAKPGTTWSELNKNKAKIQQIPHIDLQDDLSDFGLLPPKQVDLKRVGINYAEDGGTKADGVIYVREGVSDLSLGGARYAQVRIQVGDGHYLKGMAVYKDDLPDGVDLLFNTNKSDTGNKLDALKKVTGNDDNPFGAVVNQLYTVDSDGKRTLTSAMNIVNEEGNWNEWSRNLSSQMLSKQNPSLAKAQLAKTYEARQKEYDEIMALTNPTVRKKLLEEFSESTDSAAVHLKAAALPRQRTQVILPIDKMPDTQIYAPNFNTGEKVVLVRYPHGGTFEIPELTVNNRQADARKILGQSKDAVGINSKVAERLSGADFDGDTVLVIPNDSRKVKSTPALEGLKDFNPRVQYRGYEGMPKIKPSTMQRQMGEVSNLITDMTIQKAPASEIVRAIRHSMVVIDSEKHGLDYKKSAQDNGISALKEKYQTGGASTLISRAGSDVRVPTRRLARVSEGGPIDPKTGAKRYVSKDEGYVDKKGVFVPRMEKSKRLAETDDAFTLVSKDRSSTTPVERIYAEHSNQLKDLANSARLATINTPRLKQSTSAKKVYASEVSELRAALDLAQRNAPLERQAQLLAGVKMQAVKEASPDMDKVQEKRERSQALETYRARTGAKKQKIEITPRQWEAIQAGAISDNMLRDILDNADMDIVRDLATPRQQTLMTPSALTRAKALFDSGATRAEVASALGVSLSTLDEATSASS